VHAGIASRENNHGIQRIRDAMRGDGQHEVASVERAVLHVALERRFGSLVAPDDGQKQLKQQTAEMGHPRQILERERRW
jgi:hypothetical protein